MILKCRVCSVYAVISGSFRHHWKEITGTHSEVYIAGTELQPEFEKSVKLPFEVQQEEAQLG